MRKTLSIFLAVIVFLGLLTACERKNKNEGFKPASMTSSGAVSTKNSKTITLNEYLMTGPTVGLVTSTYPLDKSSVPEMYLFEDGKVYYVYSVDEDGFVTQDSVLTLGQIAKMTDEELLEHARKYKNLYCKPTIEYFIDSEYTFADILNWEEVYKTQKIGIFHSENVKGGRCFECSENGDIYFSMIVRIDYNEYSYQGVTYPMKRDKDGNIFFLKDREYYAVEDETHIVLNSYGSYKCDVFSEDTPYDGRYGVIPFPEGHVEIKHENIMTTGEYSLHIYTDISGNVLEKESIEVEALIENNENTKADISDLFYMINMPKGMGIVYDSQFSVFCKRDIGPYLLFRTNDYSVVLDGINDDGILLD